MKEKGALGFSESYWEKNYSEPEEMDNIVNAKEHAAYMKSLFQLEGVDISSVIDLGFGMGILFKEVLKTFKPYRAYGLEPSSYIFKKVNPKKLSAIESTKLVLENIDLMTWAEDSKSRARTKIFDLGLCTSVFQYLSDEEILKIVPVMSERIRYLYFSVPTDIELNRQISDLEFFDEYAIRRTKEEYLQFLLPHFAVISSRLLESKVHFNEDTTPFTDLLFRRD